MAVLREIPTDGGYSGMEWMATAAFLGALYCTVLGVFKRFRASMHFSMAEMETVSVQEQSRAVYRPFSSDATYSFNVIQETPNGSALPSYPVAPKIEPVRPRPTAPPLAPIAPSIPPGNQAQVPGTSAGTSKSESKPSSSSKKTKTSESAKTGKTKDSKGKKTDKSGKIVEGKELTEKEKLKKEKAKKERNEKKKKEEQLKKEKEKKLKAKEEKKLKAKEEKKTKGKAPSQPVASVTIDEEAVASNQAAMNPKIQQAAMNPMVNQAASKYPIARNPVASPPPYQEEAFSKVGQNVRNPNVQSQPSANQGGFTSSWDQVAEHRQNMQRDVTMFSTPAKRNVGNQNNGKEINSLYITSSNSPRNNNPNNSAGRSGRYSPPSDFSSGESDTEA